MLIQIRAFDFAHAGAGSRRRYDEGQPTVDEPQPELDVTPIAHILRTSSRRCGADRFEQPVPVLLRQPDVAQQHVESLEVEQPQPVVDRCGGLHAGAGAGPRVGEEVTGVFLVVDDSAREPSSPRWTESWLS
jgi:hypothetical protein